MPEQSRPFTTEEIKGLLFNLCQRLHDGIFKGSFTVHVSASTPLISLAQRTTLLRNKLLSVAPILILLQ